MDDIETIKKRIENTTYKKGSLYKIMMTILLVAALGIGFLIYARNDPEATVLNSVFGSSLNFHYLNENVDKTLDRMFNFNIVDNNDKDLPVSGSVNYISLGDDLYKCEDMQVKMLKKGIVSYIEKDTNSYFVVISYQNSIKASYFFLESLLVKVGDELKKGDTFANYENNFKVIFTKNNKKITYEEVFN